MGTATNSGTPLKEITVLLVEDHALMREGVRQVISIPGDIHVIGEVSDGEAALEMIQHECPDVVLLDVNLPDMNGLEIISRLRDQACHSAIVMLTVYDDREQMVYAVRAGAAGFCAKDIQPERLVETIRQVAAGYHVIRDQVLDAEGALAWADDWVVDTTGVYTIDAAEHYSPLSRREMEILRYVTRGYTNQEIALILTISHQTVKNHMTNILRKLNVQDRTQAAVYAIKQGWVRI